MKGRRLIFLFVCFVSFNAFSQWKSYYPQEKTNKKRNSLKNQEKQKTLYLQHFFSFVKEKALENYDQAQQELKKCIELNQDEPSVFYELALLYKQDNNLILAKNEIEKAINIDQNNKWYLMLYAEILELQRDYKNAAQQYKKLIEINNKNKNFYYALAEIYLLDKNYTKAISVYDSLEEQEGFFKPISMQKYQIYMQINKREKAIEELLKIIGKDPLDVETLEFLSEAYLLNNQKEKAFEVFKKISSLDPNNGRVHLTLADYYREEGQNTKSFEELKSAFISSKIGVDIKSQILASYFSIIDINDTILEQAYILAKLLINTHPDNFEPYLIYGDLLYGDKKYSKAKDQYLIVLEKNKRVRQVWNQILFIYAEENNFTEILKISEEGLNYFATDPLIYYFNGIANRKFNNNHEAALILEMGVEFVFENDLLLLEYYSVLGDVFFSLNNYDKSDYYYEKALFIDPENLIVLNNYSYYLSLRKHNLNKAKEMSLKCNLKEKDNSTYQDTYAWILYQLRDFEGAIKWIEKALENGGSDSAVIVEHYGDILYKLGDIDEAINQWIRASKIGEGSDLLNKKISEKKIYD